jgi:hypothetical protein
VRAGHGLRGRAAAAGRRRFALPSKNTADLNWNPHWRGAAGGQGALSAHGAGARARVTPALTNEPRKGEPLPSICLSPSASPSLPPSPTLWPRARLHQPCRARTHTAADGQQHHAHSVAAAAPAGGPAGPDLAAPEPTPGARNPTEQQRWDHCCAPTQPLLSQPAGGD